MLATFIRFLNSILRVQNIIKRNKSKKEIENQLFSIYCEDKLSNKRLFFKYLKEQGFETQEKIAYYDSIINYFKKRDLTRINDIAVLGKIKFKWLDYSNYKNISHLVMISKVKENFTGEFTNFCESLSNNGKSNIATRLNDAKKYLNGLTDGWFDFKNEVDSIFNLYKTELSDNELSYFECLRVELNKMLGIYT